MTKRKKKQKENKRAKEEKKNTNIYKLLFMITKEECFQLTAKRSGTCCISNFKTKRVIESKWKQRVQKACQVGSCLT